MTTYRTPSLTAAEIRKIGNQAVADVASKKITTTGTVVMGNAAKVATAQSRANQRLNNLNDSAIQKSLADLALSQDQGRGYFRDAFNKARKG